MLELFKIVNASFIHSGNWGFLALTELFQKQLTPSSPSRTSASKTSTWFMTAATGALLLTQQRTSWWRWLCWRRMHNGSSMTCGFCREPEETLYVQFVRHGEILIFISIKVTPSGNLPCLRTVCMSVREGCVSVIILHHYYLKKNCICLQGE